ncbi:MAG: hypothetical protein CBB71_19375 [Rhodopirellula sp. TMED11]|nr:MAG: hypothetical protein CBB71_19375 [Rhodopirellula sp. TMED11]
MLTGMGQPDTKSERMPARELKLSCGSRGDSVLLNEHFVRSAATTDLICNQIRLVCKSCVDGQGLFATHKLERAGKT